MSRDVDATDSQRRQKKPKPPVASPWSTPQELAEIAEREALKTAPPPPPEVRATSILRADERMPGGASQVIVAALKADWEPVVATYSRGPIMHSTTREFLRMADIVIVKGARGEERFLGSWVDGKFDYAYAGLHGQKADKVNSSELKARIKE